ncbi:MAG: hypothetical protein ACKOEV_05345, partial [Cytophagales bacterium]
TPMLIFLLTADGTTKFWDLNTNKDFFEHIHLGESDWVVKNKEGFFNGTGNARKHIHFVAFYRPDLLSKIFQNRGGNDRLNGVQGRLLKSPPPTVKVAVIPCHGLR